MKIKLEELQANQAHLVKVEGGEEWLDKIYRNFPVPAGESRPKLTGWFEFTRLEGDYVQLRGELTYQPFVSCSRCNQAIVWPLQEGLDLCFLPERPPVYAAERDLSPQELDEYYVDENGELDLEQTINDAVVLAIPTQTIPPLNAQHECQVCQMKVDSDCLFSSQKEEVHNKSPFAVLKGIKLDD